MILKINSKQSIDLAYIKIMELFEKHHYLRLTIKENSRTLDQNAWCFQAYKMLSVQGDLTQSECRNYCKYNFGLSIRAASDPEFAELLKPMLQSLTYENRIKSMMFVDVTSTFTVDQMSQYINEILNHFSDKKLPEKIK